MSFVSNRPPPTSCPSAEHRVEAVADSNPAHTAQQGGIAEDRQRGEAIR